jgi:hypothetical protein
MNMATGFDRRHPRGVILIRVLVTAWLFGLTGSRARWRTSCWPIASGGRQGVRPAPAEIGAGVSRGATLPYSGRHSPGTSVVTSLGQGAGSLSRTVASASTVAMPAATSTPAVEANWAAPSSVWKAQPSGRPTPIKAAGAR